MGAPVHRNMQFVGGREARLVRQAVLVARARRRTVLRPFGLAATAGGFVEIHPFGEGLLLERLRADVRRAAKGGGAALVYEGESNGDDVFVVEVFADVRADGVPAEHVVPVEG